MRVIFPRRELRSRLAFLLLLETRQAIYPLSSLFLFFSSTSTSSPNLFLFFFTYHFSLISFIFFLATATTITCLSSTQEGRCCHD